MYTLLTEHWSETYAHLIIKILDIILIAFTRNSSLVMENLHQKMEESIVIIIIFYFMSQFILEIIWKTNKIE